MTQTEVELFEQEAKKQDLPLALSHKVSGVPVYLHRSTQIAWKVWQAARQSGKVEPVENQWLIQMRGEYLQTRGVWERPDHRGYTNDINEAGRYSEATAKEAERIMPEKCKAVRLPLTHPSAPTQDFLYTVDRHFLVNLVAERQKRIDELEQQLKAPAQGVPEWMAEISGNLKTQDNRITADPLFVVLQKSPIVVDEDYDHDRIVWVDDEGNEAEEGTVKQLDYMRSDVDDLHFLEDEIELGEDDRQQWRRLAIKEADQFVTACLTESGAKAYLKRDGHNLNQPFIFVTSLYRNEEMKQLRNWLLEAPNQPSGEWVRCAASFTVRGFQGYKAKDYYGHEFSIQKSSLATEDCIWFGVNDAQPQVLHGDARKLGVKTNATSGWVDYPLPEEVNLCTRMHLSQQQVQEILPVLNHFAQTGELPQPPKDKTQEAGDE